MMETPEGSRLVLQVGRDRASDALARSPSLGLEGGISLVVTGPGPEPGSGIRLSIEHLGLVGPGTVVEGMGPTGLISILGIPEEGGGTIADEGEGVASVSVVMRALVLYDAVDKRLGFQQKDDRFISFVETFTGILQGRVRSVGGPAEELVVEEGSLILSYQSGGLGWIPRLEVSLDDLAVSRLLPTTGIIKPRFSLRIRPVGFKISDDDPKPSGSSWKDQLNQAIDIWHHCGIALDVQEIKHVVVKREIKFSMDLREMRSSWTDPDAWTIEVYFSANDLPNGGGQSARHGMAKASIAVTDNNKETPRLVAHEIGHVLMGIHPADRREDGEWNGDRGSVLEPRGGLTRLTLLSADKCERARNAVLRILKP